MVYAFQLDSLVSIMIKIWARRPGFVSRQGWRIFLTSSPWSRVLGKLIATQSRNSNPKIHYRVHKSPPMLLILIHMQSVYTFPTFSPKIHSNIILPSMSRSSTWSLPVMLSDQNFVCMSHIPMRAIYPAHPILDFITVTIFMKRTSYEAPPYAAFSSLPPISPSYVQLFPSAPCSQSSGAHPAS
jgi:hypothetical protein